MNRFWTGQGPCHANLHKLGLTLWLWPATDHEPRCRHVPINKIWRWTESTPRSGWWRSHMAGIYSDYSTREVLINCFGTNSLMWGPRGCCCCVKVNICQCGAYSRTCDLSERRPSAYSAEHWRCHQVCQTRKSANSRRWGMATDAGCTDSSYCQQSWVQSS